MFTWEIMSSLFKNPNHVLFKDPINSGVAQFDMPNQTVKNGLKAKKIKLPQMNFFFSKNN